MNEFMPVGLARIAESAASEASPRSLTGDSAVNFLPADLDLAAMEQQFIREALRRTGNNKTHAARLLNISWFALNRKMKKHGIIIGGGEMGAPVGGEGTDG